jgi:hypothetical protein
LEQAESSDALSFSPVGLLRHSIVINKCLNLLWRLVVPKSMRLEVLAHCHDAATAGHLGVSNTYRRISQFFCWPYHPQANGRVERFDATLINSLATVLNTHQNDWAKFVAPAVRLRYLVC